MQFFTHDNSAFRAVLRDLQSDPGQSISNPDDLIKRLLRVAVATYTPGANGNTHGSTSALSFDWSIALDDARSVEEVVGAVSSKLDPHLTQRIRYLRSFDAPPVRGRLPMSHMSLKHAVQFLIYNDRLPLPSMTVTVGGHVLLEWARSQYRYFAVEFLGDEGAVYFLLIHGRKRIRGRTAMSELTNIVSPTVIRNWYHGTTKQARSARGPRR